MNSRECCGRFMRFFWMMLLQVKEKGKMSHIFSEKELESLSELMQMRSPDWGDVVQPLYHDKHLNPMAFEK